MNKLVATFVAVMFGFASVSVLAADDMKKAEKGEKKEMKKHDMKDMKKGDMKKDDMKK